MFRKNFYFPLVRFTRLFLRLAIATIVILSTFPVDGVQAGEVSETSSALTGASIAQGELPPEVSVEPAWTHPNSMMGEPPAQILPPPLSVHYPTKSPPPGFSPQADDLEFIHQGSGFDLTSDGAAISQAMAGSLPNGINPSSLPPGITIDTTYDVVMGFVDPGESVAVSLGSEGYGAAVADGVGFFWTPIWHNTGGYQLGIDCDDSLSIVVGTDPAIDIVPPCMTGGIDVLNDKVQGSITGDTGGTSVTAALGSFDFYFLSGAFPPSTGSPQVTGDTAGDGSFGLSFTGIADLGAESMVSMDIIYAGVNVRSYLYPESPVFMVHQYNAIAGFAGVNQTVSATVYESDGTTERWSGSTNASHPHGFYTFFELPIEIDDVIKVTLDGEPTLTTDVIALGNFQFDVSANTLLGNAPSGQLVRASMRKWSGEDRLYKEAHATAISGDTFAMSFSPTDLRSRDEVLVVVSDTNGNQVQIASGPPYVGAYISLDSNLDCVLGRLDGPDLPIFVSLDKGDGEVYTRETEWTADAGNKYDVCFVLRDSGGNMVDFSPGDIVSLDSGGASGWSGSVEVVDFTWTGDTANDIISGTTADGDLELTVHQWQDGLYPLHGTATMQLPVSSGGFSASLNNFDVRDGVTMDFSHYDAVTGYGVQTNGWSYWPTLPYFELHLPYGISGMVGSPGETVEAWLYDTDGTSLLAQTSDDGDGDPYRFWLGDFGGHALEVGYKVVVSTSGGWSGEMIVPDLSIDGDIISDIVTASSPIGLLFMDVYNADYSQGLSAFIPAVTGASWSLSNESWDLYNADRVSVSYQEPDGNRARREVQLGEVYYVGTWLGAGSQDWIWGNALPDTDVTIITPGETLYAYADPECSGCWSASTSLYPGDGISVTAGDGLYSVDFSITDPFTAAADSSTDQVSGQVGGWTESNLDIYGNWGDEAHIMTDASGNYLAAFSDIPRGGDGRVQYAYLDDGAQIESQKWFKAPDLVLDVFTPYNMIEGVYEPGHTIILEVYDDLDNLKGSISLPVEEIWGSMTGFTTSYHQDLWVPGEPDIVPGDKVYGYVDVAGTIPDAIVLVGEITGDVDVDTDSISGTITFPDYFPVPGSVWVECQTWGAPEGAENKWVEVTLDASGQGDYFCQWDPNTEWDVETNQDIAVSVHDPDGHRIFDVFYKPSYELNMDINYGHDWIEGWYPPGYEVTFTVYKSDKETEKASTTFMTQEIPWWGGGTGFSTNLEGVYWEPERPDIQAGDWVLGEVVVDTTTYTAEVQLGTITGDIDVMDNSITGTIYASWLPQDVEVPIWCDSYSGPGGLESKEDQVLPDGIDTYTCAWDPGTEWDIKAGDDIGVRYGTPDGHSVHNVFKAYTDELILNIHYDHDWIDGNYRAGHTVNLTVFDSDDHVKATINLPTGYIEGWGDSTGFATYQEGVQWMPDHPDIQPGDRVHGEVDDGSQFTADVVVGMVTGETDLDNNSISGTVDASWLMPGPVDVGCYIWEENGRNVYDSVVPDGTYNYECVFEGDNYYDIFPGTNLMVAYIEPDGHQVIGDFSPPAPYLQIENWFIGDGSPGVGGNAAFWVQYSNQGKAPAENVEITASMAGMTYLRDTSGITPTGSDTVKTWDLGVVDPGDWIGFVLFGEVTGAVDDEISNTVEIVTSDPYDQGESWEKISTWEGSVAANDTYLNVDKWTWTWNPAPGEDYVYTINICNNGSTSSSEISVVDTLPTNTIFSGEWWGADGGWQEVDYDAVAHTFELTHTCVSPATCSEAYVRVTVDPGANPGDDLINHVAITADNDLSTGDDEAEVHHNVGEPYMDLGIWQNWHWGVLVPGGYYRYGISFRNEGNIGVDVPIEIKATLPPGTSFDGWDSWGAVSVGDPVEAGSVITWTLAEGLPPGFGGTIEVWLTVDMDTLPGTVLEHLAEIDIQTGESDVDNNMNLLSLLVNEHGPNLRIRKEGGIHGDGRNAWYRLRVENIGDQTVNDVVVTDIYPAGMELDGDVNTNYWEGWSWSDNDPEDQALSVYLDRVEPGWNFEIYFNTIIPGEDPLEPGVIYVNIAEIEPVAGDMNPDDNFASYTMATGPDMYVEKTWESGDFLPGEEITYLITFGNMHHDNDWWWDMAGNAILTDELPEGMSFISAEMHWCESTEWCAVTPDITGQTLTWNLYPIGRSNWNEIRLTVKIGEVEQTNPLINEIMIGSDQPLDDVDPYPDNNTSAFVPELDLDAPTITSANHTSFVVGTSGSFTITTTGYPTPGITYSGALPAGLALVDNGAGTATLSGTPAVGTEGIYTLTITASNGVLPNDQQTFTLTVNDPPIITSADYTTFVVGTFESFTITTTGYPTPGITYSGALPDGVELVDNSDGTGTLSGMPAVGTGGVYPLTITASNGVLPNDQQTLTLTVNDPPTITSIDHTTFVVGTSGSFTITTTGYPTPAITYSGALPDGVTLVDNGDGTGKLAGMPVTGTEGVYTLTITASNGVLPNDQQIFELTVESGVFNIFLPLIKR